MADNQVHLMVQCMESWLLADRPVLEKYYGHGFKGNGLPGNPQVEAIPKQDVLQGLMRATKDSARGEYHKTRHGFAILQLIDPVVVGNRSPHARAFFDFLRLELTHASNQGRE